MIAAFMIGTLMQVIVISVKPLAAIFKVTPLSIIQWIIVLLLSIVPIIVVELQKAAFKKSS